MLTMEGRRALVGVALCIALLSGRAFGQLTPDRLYYGIGRPMPMTVRAPGDQPGLVEIQLLQAGTAKVLERAVLPGGTTAVNLATFFPSLAGAEAPSVVYAQLAIGGRKIGPAVVLQPLVEPVYATVEGPAMPGRPAPWRFVEPSGKERFLSGYRAYVDKDAVLVTDKGEIRLSLRPGSAPNTVWNFRHLAESGFYDGTIFHRVVALDTRGHPFVIQGGDPTGTGNGGPGYFIDLEPSDLRHDFGVVSMARNPDPNSNGSQFFICLSREGTARLDGQYTAFGAAVGGAEVIQAIAALPVAAPTAEARDRPVEPPVLREVRLVDAPPYGEGPGAVPAPGAVPVRR